MIIIDLETVMLSKANTRHVGAEAADDDVRSGDVFRNA